MSFEFLVQVGKPGKKKTLFSHYPDIKIYKNVYDTFLLTNLLIWKILVILIKYVLYIDMFIFVIFIESTHFPILSYDMVHMGRFNPYKQKLFRVCSNF